MSAGPDDLSDVDAQSALWFLEILAGRSTAPSARIRGYADIIAKALLGLERTEDARVKPLAESNEQRRRNAAEWYARVRKQLANLKAADYSRSEAVSMLAERHGCSRSTIYRAILDDVARRTACDNPDVKGDP